MTSETWVDRSFPNLFKGINNSSYFYFKLNLNINNHFEDMKSQRLKKTVKALEEVSGDDHSTKPWLFPNNPLISTLWEKSASEFGNLAGTLK